MKQQQTKVMTAIVGSYPKPDYVYGHDGRTLLDSLGFGLTERQGEIGEKAFTQLLDRAALGAIEDQNHAGIDYMTDGEERRGHYVLHIVNQLGGIDSKNLQRISIRGGTDQRMAPRVIAKITYRQPIVVDEFRFMRQYVKGIAKISLPGPTTVADCLADEFYGGDRRALAFDYADAIRQEVSALIDSGCTAIQFDDPVLLRYPDAAREWGLAALERCFTGLENKATYIVHICRGYPNKPFEAQGIAYKADAGYYQDVLSWLAGSQLDIVSIEGAQSQLDLSVLSAIGDKTVMLGVLDVGEEAVETVDALIAHGKEALRHIPAKQLILAPDCGMLEISRDSAKQKLINLQRAAGALNGI